MRVLLDAHALLWWLLEPERLSRHAHGVIAEAEEVRVSSGTLIEIAMKRATGKLPIEDDWPERAQDDGFELLAFGWEHASRLQRLEYATVAGREHRDPFDRMLVAQSLVDRIPVVTRDPAIGAYGCGVIW